MTIPATDNPYLALRNLNLIQRQAGVDPEIAELVGAYGRLLIDRGRPLEFHDSDPAGTDPVFLSLRKKNPELDPRIADFLARYSRFMAARRLPALFNVAHLARRWNVSERYLQWVAHNPRGFYREFRIPKKNGAQRVILAPTGFLRARQDWILEKILNRQRSHAAARGFVRGCSILDNARPHAGRRVVVGIDLQDFFPSITHRQVRRVFERIGYPYRVANLLANLCTVDGRLPQGAPTSPALSNLVALNLDRRLDGLRRKMKFRYTRYADDLTFSSNHPRLPALLPFFKQIIREEGFAVNERKVRVMRAGARQEVTGVVVNEQPNLPREQRRRLRAAVHRLKTQGEQFVNLKSACRPEADPVNVLRGHLSYLQMIRPERQIRDALDLLTA